MRAKFVFEKFKKESDSIKDLGIGYSKRILDSISWKILEFIKSKGEEGASLTEIQYYIWTELEGHDPKEFWEKSLRNYYKYDPVTKQTITYKKQDKSRKTRGHWNTQLYYHNLLNKFCRKNDKGKWVFVKFPEPGQKFYR